MSISRAEEPENTVAFLPFYILVNPSNEERQLLLLGAGTSDYLDGLFSRADSERSEAACHAGLLHLLRARCFDALHAAQLRPSSPLLGALRRFTSDTAVGPGAPGYAVSLWTGESTSTLRAACLQDLPTKIRRNALYYRNRAQREGDLRFRLASEEDCLDVFEALVLLHAERWQAVEQQGVLSDAAVLAHHRLALPALARAGLLRLAVLTLGPETIGILYSLIDNSERRKERTQYFYLPAFSIAHAELRPGTLLNALAIDAATQEGVHTIGFLRGEESYKQHWHAESRPTFGITFRPANASSPPCTPDLR